MKRLIPEENGKGGKWVNDPIILGNDQPFLRVRRRLQVAYTGQVLEDSAARLTNFEGPAKAYTFQSDKQELHTVAHQKQEQGPNLDDDNP